MYMLMLTCIVVIWYLIRYAEWRKAVLLPIEKLAGPKRYPIIGTLHTFREATRPEIFKIMLETSEKYKPFYRTWNASTPEINIMKPEHVEQILTSSVQIKKASGYRLVKDWLGDGLLLSYGSKWHQRRKLITPTFHFKILDSFMNIFEDKARILVGILEELANNEPFNIYPYITSCALDIICETAMGVPTNTLTDRTNNYALAVYSTTELVLRRALSPLQQTVLYPLLSDGKMFRQNLRVMREFRDKVIQERRHQLKQNAQDRTSYGTAMPQKKRLSFLDLLLDTSDGLPDDGLKEEVDTFMFEGHDTSTAAICWSIMLLANHPDVQEKVYQEIKGVLHDRKTPSTLLDLHQLHYLERCAKEALRLYPSVPIVGRTLIEDITIDGYKIPKGTDVNINIYEVHRNPEIYNNPEKFDPDRFLPENCINRHPYAYIPFSAGLRNCVGQKFAMYEEKTILASLIRSYKILPVDRPDTLKMVFEITLKPFNGMKISLEKRID